MANSRGMIKEIMTGIFLSVIVALLIFFTIIISGVDLLHGRHTRVCEVRFVDVGALKVQDPVYVRGLKVGSVQSLKLVPGAVMVRLTLDSDVVLREDYSMTIGKTSMLGGTCLQINEGVSENVLPETSVLNGVAPTDMMADLGELVNELRSAINAEELRATISNIQKASADFAVLTERIRKGEGTMGKLLSEDSKLYDDLMASLDNLKAVTSDLRSGKGLLGKLISEEDTTYEDLRATIANLNTVTGNLSEGKGLLGKLINEEDTTYEDLRATIANLNTVTGNLSEGKGFLGKLMSEEDESYNDFKASLANIRLVTEKLNDPATGFGRLLSQESPLITDLEATAANLRLITERLEKGDGTLGKLVNDDAIAAELEAAIKDVRQIIDNMRDTAPITTFSSLFFGGL